MVELLSPNDTNVEQRGFEEFLKATYILKKFVQLQQVRHQDN